MCKNEVPSEKVTKRYCKGCHCDVTESMFCYCGEFPLSENSTYTEEELRKIENNEKRTNKDAH